MSKISDRELLELENDDLEIPIRDFKKTNKNTRTREWEDNEGDEW